MAEIGNFLARVQHVHVKHESRRSMLRPARSVNGKITQEGVYRWEPIDRIEVMYQILGPSKAMKDLGAPHSYGQVTQGVVVKPDVPHPFRDLVPGQVYKWSVVDGPQISEDL